LKGGAQIIGTLYFKVWKVRKTIPFLQLQEKDPLYGLIANVNLNHPHSYTKTNPIIWFASSLTDFQQSIKEKPSVLP